MKNRVTAKMTLAIAVGVFSYAGAIAAPTETYADQTDATAQSHIHASGSASKNQPRFAGIRPDGYERYAAPSLRGNGVPPRTSPAVAEPTHPNADAEHDALRSVPSLDSHGFKRQIGDGFAGSWY